MDGIGRRADGRRVFTAEFKREQIARIERNEITAAELARELQVQPGLIRHWKPGARAGQPPLRHGL